MARYRKIDVRVWGDEKFRELSPPKPNGQTLWFYLLTGPQTTTIPGVFSAGESAMAEALRWPLKGFREGFREVLRKGLAKADFKAPLVWLPNAIRYNPPENPNVVKGWRATWDELPECDLKHQAWCHLKSFTQALGEGFAKGFAERLPEPYRKGLANQEQEQEQEQEQDLPPKPPTGGAMELDPVYSYWREKLGHGLGPHKPGPKQVEFLDERRREGFSNEDLKLVVDGALIDALRWPERLNNCEVKRLYRDRDAVVKFIGLARSGPPQPSLNDLRSKPVRAEDMGWDKIPYAEAKQS